LALVPLLNGGRLLAGAFEIATRFNPNQFRWFLARERGTIFQAAIERIEPPRDSQAPPPERWYIHWRGPQKHTYVASGAWGADEALDIAKSLAEWASEMGTVFITVEGHPLDARAVTTPDLYLHAVAMLGRFGHAVRYSLTDGVCIERTQADRPS
jgi:hypothetical protein